MRKANKRAQEEIVGFVLVVVIVAVIFLIFLGLTIRQKSPITQKESRDVSEFLESMMDYTSKCAVVSDKAYVSLGMLERECYSGSSCRAGDNACSVLTRTIQEAVESNWKMGADRPVKGYIFNATYSSDALSKNVILLTKGNCTNERIGAEHLSPVYPGNIRSLLEICY